MPLTPLQDRVRIAAFRAVYEGKQPSARELARHLGEETTVVETAIEGLVECGLMTIDEGDRITGSHGLSLAPSDYRVIFNVGPRYVWCAVDAVGIPAAMRVDAEIVSTCFACREPVRLTIKAGQPTGTAADSLRIGFAIRGVVGKVIEDVCPMLNFFCSEGHANHWAGQVANSKVLTIAQAADMGRRTWSDVVLDRGGESS